MKIFICNAFSLSMLDRDAQTGSPSGYVPRSTDPVAHHYMARMPRPVDDPAKLLAGSKGAEIISAVGHADVAALFAAQLKMPVAVNRVSVKLTEGDLALVGQYIGPRLPEGVTTLPDGATIEWWVV
jgi:hypothetical protein